MPRIHSLACIDPAAQIADDAEIGPWCVIGPNVSIGSECHLIAHVHLAGHTIIGARTIVYPYASLGGPPQSVSYRGEPTRLIVGAHCDIREAVTMNVGSQAGGGITLVGDHGLYMAHSHVGHDCRVGDHVVLGNNVSLGGHCWIGDHVTFGDVSAAIQRVRIGSYAMIGSASVMRSDLIPFGLANGTVARLFGLNVVTMEQHGFPPASIANAHQAYCTLFASSAPMKQRLVEIQSAFGSDPAVARILAFVENTVKRPLCRPDAVSKRD